MDRMIRALVALLAAGATAGQKDAPIVHHEDPARPAPPVVRLAAPGDVAELCKALVPAERLRGKGDALQRGDAQARQDAGRDLALERRYEILLSGGRLAFAPYGAGERQLALSYKAELAAAGGAARVWTAEERGLPVEVPQATARRILDARAAGTLVLAVVFDLPEDATCAGGASRPPRWVVPMEPVSWTYRDGEAVLARGGEGSDRPVVTAAHGAKPRVEIGDPVSGAPEMKGQVAAREADLRACYEEALRREPALDGVLVAELGGAAPALAADSVGDPGLAACVRRVLDRVPSPARVAIPIRFVLDAPGAETPPAPAAAPPAPAPPR